MTIKEAIQILENEMRICKEKGERESDFTMKAVMYGKMASYSAAIGIVKRIKDTGN